MKESKQVAINILIAVALMAAAVTAGFLIRPSGIHDPSVPPGPPPSGVHEVAPPGKAKAAAEAGPYEMWVMPPGPLCIHEKGLAYWHYGTASDYFDTLPQIDISHPDTGCVGFPRRRMIVITTYVDHAVGACAKTSGVNYTWQYAYGRWTWIAEQATIWVNVAAEAKTACFSKSTGVAHVASHELGHALGLAHNSDPSVMGSWAYWWATELDKQRVKMRYTTP